MDIFFKKLKKIALASLIEAGDIYSWPADQDAASFVISGHWKLRPWLDQMNPKTHGSLCAAHCFAAQRIGSISTA
jgi:hypothetical protein